MPINALNKNAPNVMARPAYGLPQAPLTPEMQVKLGIYNQTQGRIDNVYDMVPGIGDVKAGVRAKDAAGIKLTPNLMGGATANIKDPYTFAFESATMVPLMGDLALAAKASIAAAGPLIARMSMRNQQLGKLAQALPYERGTIGIAKQADSLPMDEASRMARAKQMGFGEDFYHASQQDITEFKPGYEDGLIFVTPEPRMANDWAGLGKYRGRIGAEAEIDIVTNNQRALRRSIDEKHKVYELMDNGSKEDFLKAAKDAADEFHQKTPVKPDDVYKTVYPVKTNVKKTFNAESDYKEIEDFLLSLDGKDGRTGMRELVDKGHHKHGNWIIYENKDVVKELKRRGYDSMWIAENVDGPQETLAIFNPKNIRSKFATYDPAKKNSAKILAGTGAAAIGAGALMNERDEYVTR